MRWVWLLWWAGSFIFLGKEELGCCGMLGAELGAGCVVSVPGLWSGPRATVVCTALGVPGTSAGMWDILVDS